MKQTLRSFVAIEIDTGVRRRAQALIDQLAVSAPDTRWVQVQNLHFTLKFLGEVPTRETPEICAVVAAAAARIAPFELEIRGVGAFPNPVRPRTIWLGAGEGSEAAVALQREIDSALKKLGYRPEARRFQPHLTIGRVRQGGPALADLAQFLQSHAAEPLGTITVEEVVLFSSQLDRSGPTYEALGRAPLQG